MHGNRLDKELCSWSGPILLHYLKKKVSIKVLIGAADGTKIVDSAFSPREKFSLRQKIFLSEDAHLHVSLLMIYLVKNVYKTLITRDQRMENKYVR